MKFIALKPKPAFVTFRFCPMFPMPWKKKEKSRKSPAAEGREPMLIRHFTAHNLRHTFCTRFCENETNLKVIQEIMGHADITTTMNIYAEATEATKRKAFANLEGKIKIR